MLRTMVVTCVMLAAVEARAEVIVVRGVEMSLPAGWKEIRKGPISVLAPTAYKGRAIEVMTVKAMPAPTVEALQALQVLFGKDKLEITKAIPLDRAGMKLVAGEGKITTEKKTLAIDLLVVPVADKAALMISFTAADQDPVLRKANTEILLSARVPGPRLSVVFNPPTKKGVVGAPKAFADNLAKLATVLDAQIKLPRALPITFKECGMANAFYAFDGTITICHEYFDFRFGLFKAAGMDDAKARDHTEGALLFSFMHEFGHALHHELKLPITGRGEDAADEIAAIYLSRFGAAGREIAKMAARAHYLTAKQPAHKDAYYDEHSFSMQRVHAILCLLYGADKAGYEPLLKALDVPAVRMAKCTREYGEKVKAWDTLLRPYMVKKTK